MNHDVFISYSSKNSTTAQAICHELEDNHIKCWMAPRDIPVGAKYASVIAQAIKSCKAVVLVFSEQSAISPWVESEINIAFSNRKPIVPYKIDAAVLEQYDEFYMMLNNRHWIESYPDFKTRFVELVEVVARLVDVELAPKANNVVPKDTAPKKPKAALKTVAKPTPVSMPASAPTPAPKRKNTVASVSTPTPSSAKTYKVGDYYNDGKKEGVVFWVDKSGEHGKIVSIDEAKLQWCTDAQYNRNINIELSDVVNGRDNTDIIMSRADNMEYPAFVWCRNKGDDWYLPAINEMKLLSCNKKVHDSVNRTLSKIGATKLFNHEDWAWYWSSSSSYFDNHADAIKYHANGINTTSFGQNYFNYVRAVATFGTPQKIVTPINKRRYQVGDYYKQWGKEGVVFWLDESGEYGKILSLDGHGCQWTYDEYDNVVASSKDDGKRNTERIMMHANSKMLHAPLWCRQKGDDWYLPAINELCTFLCNENIINIINATLERIGADMLGDIGDNISYWSSTEDEDDCIRYAKSVYMCGGIEAKDKHDHGYARAVATFINPEAKVPAKVYKVGDYYNENGMEGIVFWVDDTGEHGKIVSLQQSDRLQWAIAKYGNLFNRVVPCGTFAHTASKIDGMQNMIKIKTIDAWQKKYPAFAWCAALGEGWYLPSLAELEIIFKDENIFNIMYNALDEYGGVKLLRSSYWSSTEDGNLCAHIAGKNRDSFGRNSKDIYNYVRAVATF